MIKDVDGRDKPGHDPDILARLASRPHCRLDDLIGVFDRLPALDLVDVFHALDHLTPDRVLVIEEARVVEADEKLAVAGIRVAGARHRDGTAHVWFAVELSLQLAARSAGASAVGAPGLRHKSIDHAVKYNAVVKSVLYQFLDPCNVPGREVGPHLDHHCALGRLQRQRIFWRRHLTPFHYYRASNVMPDLLRHRTRRW